MSTKSKLLAMTENLELPQFVPSREVPAGEGDAPGVPKADTVAVTAGHRFPPVATGLGARTGPGQMLQFRGHIMAAESEANTLRERLKEHDGSNATRKLEPGSIITSRWANRHSDSFETAEFARLKQDIELAGGNIQAISVRPAVDAPGKYEIVFGHRRHRACSELGIAVLATIDANAMSDQDLFSAMDRENRERADLSAYEQGTMYRRALDEKLYASNRRLAEALGVSHTWVANVLQVADLPAPVLDCFRSRLEIQPKHARLLAGALETDRKGVLRRADKLRAQGQASAATAVVEALLSKPSDPQASPYRPLRSGEEQVGRWSRDGAGRLFIEIEPKFLTKETREAVLASISEALTLD